MKSVIHPRELPTKIPLAHIVAGWLLMDRFHANEFWFGVWWTCTALLVLVAMYSIYKQKYVSVIK